MSSQPTPDPQILSAVHAAAERHPELHTVVLYGSAARGTLRRDGDELLRSDVDIAVASEQPLGIEKWLDLQAEFAQALGIEVDLVDLREVHGLLLKEIMTGGYPVVNNKPAFRAQKASEMYRDEYTFAPVIREARRKRLHKRLG
jgi:predicted nucleotidyltransferase